MSAAITEVAETGMFSIHDVPWICRALGICIRITIDEATYDKIDAQGVSEVDPDALYGRETGPVRAHMLFKWMETGGSSGRLVGHFDILYPRQGPVAMLLKQDAPRLEMRIHVYKIDIYKIVQMYITFLYTHVGFFV